MFFRYFFFKAQLFLTTEEQFFSKKNRKVLSLNPIVNKNEERISVKHSFSHSKYMPPTTLTTFIQEKLVDWLWKRLLNERFSKGWQGRHFIILFRRYSTITVCFSTFLTCFCQPFFIMLSFLSNIFFCGGFFNHHPVNLKIFWFQISVLLFLHCFQLVLKLSQKWNFR